MCAYLDNVSTLNLIKRHKKRGWLWGYKEITKHNHALYTQYKYKRGWNYANLQHKFYCLLIPHGIHVWLNKPRRKPFGSFNKYIRVKCFVNDLIGTETKPVSTRILYGET